MKKKLLLLLPFLLLAGCKAREKPDIVVTSFVSYDAVTNIVGDKLKVKNIVPWGSELHDFEPTPRDIEDINNAIICLLILRLKHGLKTLSLIKIVLI